MPKVAKYVRVSGRVQGVFFRAWTQQRAQELGLQGWVRNQPDGTVLALLAGPDDRVQDMIVELRRGPPMARVEGVASRPAEWPDITGFEITG
ncbi:MAG: acylphosphatase [Pseudomonadota bacterium]